MSGKMPSFTKCAEIECLKVIVLFRNEFDTKAAEKTQSGERLKRDRFCN